MSFQQTGEKKCQRDDNKLIPEKMRPEADIIQDHLRVHTGREQLGAAYISSDAFVDI